MMQARFQALVYPKRAGHRQPRLYSALFALISCRLIPP
jgi:hypothetical protein